MEHKYLPNIFDVNKKCWGYEVHIYFQDGTLFCQKNDLKPIALKIPPEQWEKFWQNCDQIEIWSWKNSYPSTWLDAVIWKVHLKFGGKEIISWGNNVFPGKDGRPSKNETTSWKNFEAAVQDLLGNIKFDPFE